MSDTFLGIDGQYFKNKVNKTLVFYPDVPRCGNSGHSYNKNGCKSNALSDHYRNIVIRQVVDNIVKV